MNDENGGHEIERARVMPEFGKATLNDCDREPIHVPGSIQPHACLVVVDRGSGAVRQVAGDVARILGTDTEPGPGIALSRLVGERNAERILHAGGSIHSRPVPLKLYEVEIETPAGRVDAVLHDVDGDTVVEFEPSLSDGPGHGGLSDALLEVQRMSSALRDSHSLDEYCNDATELLRDLTGFDRVMIYRFMEDGSGEVIAESRNDDVDSYLGLHYPESDIPKQARELYRKSWIRAIPDVDYRPRPLEPALDPRTGRPLDLSFAMSRSVSPLHLQYLKNMGVGASMSISIVLGGELWGLIACHHLGPYRLACDVRAACELFGQVFSLQLESWLRAEDYTYRLAQRSAHAQLVQRLPDESDLADVLSGHRPDLLDYIRADGVVLFIDGRYSSAGRTPDRDDVQRLIEMLDRQDDGVFATDRIAEHVPDAKAFAALASGMLALSVSREPRDYIIWFRPEVVQTVTWAGNPHKAVKQTPDGERLTPRSSFAAWRETVRGRSLPWKDIEIEAARALRLSILEVVLKRIHEVARERKRNEERQNLLLAELDHRVKNTLANIQSLIRFTSASATDLNDYVDSLARRIGSMAHAHSLLSESRWEGADLATIVEEELRAHHADGDRQSDARGPAIRLTPQAALSISLVLHELVTNAAKHGALSVPEGRVEISWSRVREREESCVSIVWRERGGPVVTPPTRMGFGRTLIERALRYDIGAEVDLRFDREGVACDVRLPSDKIVAREALPGRDRACEDDGRRALRILVVEDSILLALDLQTTLERFGHTVVGPTGRVPEALTLIERERPDAAILDINLGDADCFGIADRLLSLDVPFFFLTGYARHIVVPERLEEIRVVSKPFRDDLLAKALTSLLRGSSTR